MNPRRMKRTGKHRMMRRLRLSGGCLHLNRNQSRRRSAVHQPKTSFRTFQFDLLLFQLRIKTKSTQNVTQRKKNDRFQRNSNSRSVQMLKTFQTNPFNYSTFIRQVIRGFFARRMGLHPLHDFEGSTNRLAIVRPGHRQGINGTERNVS